MAFILKAQDGAYITQFRAIDGLPDVHDIVPAIRHEIELHYRKPVMERSPFGGWVGWIGIVLDQIEAVLDSKSFRLIPIKDGEWKLDMYPADPKTGEEYESEYRVIKVL